MIITHVIKSVGKRTYNLYARLWAWLARPGNVGYGSMTIVDNCTCTSCAGPYIPSAKEDWDAEFYKRTLTNVEFVLNPPPYAPQIPGYIPPWDKLKLPTSSLRVRRELWSYRGW